MLHTTRRLRTAMAALVVLAQLAQWSTPLAALAQTQRPPVDRGQEYYEQSRFDEAIALLKDLVDRGALQGTELTKAQELLARSYVKKGYPAQGKEMFKALLRSTPEWRPDPIRVPPDETAVFEQALKEYQQGNTGAGAATPAPTTTQPPTATPTQPASPAQIGLAKEEKKKGMPWLWIGLGALAVGGIVAVAAGGGSDDGGAPPSLPGFPGTP